MGTPQVPTVWLWSRMRRPRLTLGLVVGIAAYVILWFATPLAPRLRFIAAWHAGTSVALIALYFGLRRSSAASIRRIAQRQGAGKWTVLAIALLASGAAFVTIAAEMPLVKNATGYEQVLRVVLMVYTIVLSWAFIQVVFALHYAHDFYSPDLERRPDACPRPGGLLFPETTTPTYGDFLYFAFTIGMTFQVSDVQVTDPSVRRVVLGHGMLSFFYATGILALTINLVAGLI